MSTFVDLTLFGRISGVSGNAKTFGTLLFMFLFWWCVVDREAGDLEFWSLVDAPQERRRGSG